MQKGFTKVQDFIFDMSPAVKWNSDISPDPDNHNRRMRVLTRGTSINLGQDKKHKDILSFPNLAQALAGQAVRAGRLTNVLEIGFQDSGAPPISQFLDGAHNLKSVVTISPDIPLLEMTELDGTEVHVLHQHSWEAQYPRKGYEDALICLDNRALQHVHIRHGEKSCCGGAPNAGNLTISKYLRLIVLGCPNTAQNYTCGDDMHDLMVVAAEAGFELQLHFKLRPEPKIPGDISPLIDAGAAMNMIVFTRDTFDMQSMD